MPLDAESLILRYRERLAWSSEETVQVLTDFVDKEDLTDDLVEYLIERTGMDLGQASQAINPRGKPFAVLAYSADNERSKPAERIDTDTEVLALEAFSELLNRPDLEHFVVVQFRYDSDTSRELLRYDRRTSVGEW